MSQHALNPGEPLPAFLSNAIIRPAASRAIASAEQILNRARQIESESQKMATEAFEASRKAGFDLGLREGLLEARVHNLETLIATDAALSQIHETICQVVVQCLRELLTELPPAERIEQAATLALETVNLQQTVVLCVHPDDLRRAVPVAQKLSALMSGGARVECRGRTDIAPGDCLLETPTGIIRCALDDQLAAIQKTLLNSEA